MNLLNMGQKLPSLAGSEDFAEFNESAKTDPNMQSAQMQFLYNIQQNSSTTNPPPEQMIVDQTTKSTPKKKSTPRSKSKRRTPAESCANDYKKKKVNKTLLRAQQLGRMSQVAGPTG